MKKLSLILFVGFALSACAQTGELSERRTNCFGKLKPSQLSTALVPVPKQ